MSCRNCSARGGRSAPSSSGARTTRGRGSAGSSAGASAVAGRRTDGGDPSGPPRAGVLRVRRLRQAVEDRPPAGTARARGHGGPRGAARRGVHGGLRRQRETAEALIAGAGWECPVETDDRWAEYDADLVLTAAREAGVVSGQGTLDTAAGSEDRKSGA